MIKQVKMSVVRDYRDLWDFTNEYNWNMRKLWFKIALKLNRILIKISKIEID